MLNALNPVADINSYIEYFTNHGYAIRPELFYDKQLLDTIRLDEKQFIFYRLANTTPIQNGAAKLQIRRWAPLQAHTVPLDEGVPPFSDKGSMEKYEINTFSYGRYMEFTDRVNFEVIDPVIAHYTKEYAIVAMETLDLLARDALVTVASAFYAGQVASFQDLTLDCKPSLEDLRVIALSMKKQLVKPRNGNRYHVIGTPDFYFDMIEDPLVQKYMTINQTTKGFYDDMGPIPPMFGLEFYETMHVDNSGEFHAIINGTEDDYLMVARSDGNGGFEYAYADATTYKVAKTDAQGNPDNYVYDSRTGQKASYIPNLKVWDLDAYNTAEQGSGEPWTELKVDRIFVLGADCLTRTEIAGHGNAKMYVKALGSAGVLDPIDQRQSIGFKIDSVGFGSTRTEAVALYYCVPTQLNADFN
jgi:hypothetical protein